MTDYIKWFKETYGVKATEGTEDTGQPLKFRLKLKERDIGHFAVPGTTIEVLDYDQGNLTATFTARESSTVLCLLDELFYYRLRYRDHNSALAAFNGILPYLGDEDPEMRTFANEILQDIFPLAEAIDDDQK